MEQLFHVRNDQLISLYFCSVGNMLTETVLSKSTQEHMKSKACHPYDKMH